MKYLRYSMVILAMVVLVSACKDREKNLTEGGYQDVSGIYRVTESICAFASVGNQFTVEQNDALLSISISGSAPAGDESLQPEENQGKLGEGSSIDYAVPPPDLSLKTSTGIVEINAATIDKSGEISVSITYASSVYNCTGKSSNDTANFTCATDGEECAFSAKKIEATEPVVGDIGGVSDPEFDDVTGSGSGPVPEEEVFPSPVDVPEDTGGGDISTSAGKTYLEKNAIGTWCFIAGEPVLVAVYVDTDLNISFSDPSKIEDQKKTGKISFISAKRQFLGDMSIQFWLPDKSEALIIFNTNKNSVVNYNVGTGTRSSSTGNFNKVSSPTFSTQVKMGKNSHNRGF